MFLVLGLGFLLDDIMMRVGFVFFWMISSGDLSESALIFCVFVSFHEVQDHT